MIPGKWFYRLAPRWQFASHCGINSLAYKLVRRTDSKASLPPIFLINNFEGFNGVDGLWLNNRHLPSRSTFNPVTLQGRGIAEVSLQHAALLQALESEKKRRIARRLAFLSHIITDVCTPPHQHGRLTAIRKQRWYVMWTVKDDWIDEAEEKFIVHQHSLFELQTLLYLRTKQFAPSLIDPLFLNGYQAASHPSDYVAEYVRSKAVMIRELDLYSQYLEHGWTNTTQQAMQQLVFPTMIATVASVWLASVLPQHSSRPTDM